MNKTFHKRGGKMGHGYGLKYLINYKGKYVNGSERITKKDKPIRTSEDCSKLERQIKDCIKKDKGIEDEGVHITNIIMLSPGRKIRRR